MKKFFCIVQYLRHGWLGTLVGLATPINVSFVYESCGIVNKYVTNLLYFKATLGNLQWVSCSSVRRGEIDIDGVRLTH